MKFKIGDRVRVIGNGTGMFAHFLDIGESATVTSFWNDDIGIVIKSDDYIEQVVGVGQIELLTASKVNKHGVEAPRTATAASIDLDDEIEIAVHEHRHDIAVEWEYRGVASEWGNAQADWPMPAEKRVTKLRCSCGDEVER